MGGPEALAFPPVTEDEAWAEATRRNAAPSRAHGFRDWLNGQRYWDAVQDDDGGWRVEQRQDKATLRGMVADFSQTYSAVRSASAASVPPRFARHSDDLMTQRT
jgi:hypothetical protein